MKYILYVEDVRLGIYLNLRRGVLKIGGNRKFLLQAREVLKHYFEVEEFDLKYPSQNKFVYSLKMSIEKFEQGIVNLRDMGIVLDQVHNLERVMR